MENKQPQPLTKEEMSEGLEFADRINKREQLNVIEKERFDFLIEKMIQFSAFRAAQFAILKEKERRMMFLN